MATVILRGNTTHTLGSLTAKGTAAPDFTLTRADLTTVSLADYKGHKLVLNIFPSVDTGTCARSVRQFNKAAASMDANTRILCISRDLPFAQSRFCGAEGIDQVDMLSDYRDGNFGRSYGVEFTDGAFVALLSRAVVVIDANGKISHTEQVLNTSAEPNYTEALQSLQND